MVRFARAKGSKASNEKLPHEATSWSDMKQDLQKSQQELKNKSKREEFNKERQENYNNFVKQTEETQESKKWAEFPADLKTIKKKKKTQKHITEKDVTEEMIDDLCYSDPEVDEELKNLTEKADEIIVQQKKSKKRKSDAPDETSTKIPPQKIQIKKPKHKKQTIKIPSVEIKQETEIKQEIEIKQETEIKQEIDIKQETEIKRETPEKNDKNHDKTIKKRRKPVPIATICINGKNEPIVQYLGFPVLQSDHDRLVQLRKSLIAKGIPHSEVQRTLKLERRKAEKHLSRIKKLVCYKCRGTGHMLSQCPMIENPSIIESTATGICFKCGSTEHNARECKVSNNFKFAKCFICREQGHIASQCPDNPKGLYPKGGACKLCGNVTHLKKDCPQYQEERKSNEVFLNVISNGNIEDIGDSVENNKKQKIVKKKVVKF